MGYSLRFEGFTLPLTDREAALFKDNILTIEEVRELYPLPDEVKQLKEINYKEDWYMVLPDNKKDWYAMVEIFKGIGCEFMDEGFDDDYCYLTTHASRTLIRTTRLSDKMEKVTLFEAIRRLQRPIKDKIDELEQRIKEMQVKVEGAQTLINQLKTQY